ncbi:hypothetical protein GF312_14710 [Candidatus Poribacteria bacterium]|nr:hypothetical protein [Candidatus Poribacteria bacterium]
MSEKGGASSHTIRSYRDTFTLVLTYMDKVRHIAADRLTLTHFYRETILDFLDWLQKDRRCTNSTRNQRLAAAEVLVMDTLECRLLEVDESQAKVMLLSYNRTNQSMEVWEEAMILQSLLEGGDLDQRRLAKIVGHSPSWVSRRLSLISKVDEEICSDIRMGVLSSSHARALMRLPRGNRSFSIFFTACSKGMISSSRALAASYATISSISSSCSSILLYWSMDSRTAILWLYCSHHCLAVMIAPKQCT